MDNKGDKYLKAIDFNCTKINDKLWKKRIETIRDVTIPGCFKRCEETGRISNFHKAAKKIEGGFEGVYFNDSDVYKIIEGVGYVLSQVEDRELEEYTDDLIHTIVDAQQKDGYLNTYFTLVKNEEKWTDMERHEDYCIGHLIEAAISYYKATGKDRLLKAVIRAVDEFYTEMITGGRNWVPGHQEIELALIKLYDETKDRKYLEFSKWLLEQRGHGHGVGENLWGVEKWGAVYAQDEKPIKEMTDISGHAVRAMYMYCAMADLLITDGNYDYLHALVKLWDSTVLRNMYLTGGIGSSKENEGFTRDYDLPNDTAYCETCASVGMVMWNHRMNLIFGESKYADIMERSIYNGALSGMGEQGDVYFYVNPLESDGTHHREPWFDVSCCPTQITRFVPSIGQYMYAVDEDNIYVNLFIKSDSRFNFASDNIRITQSTDYPWDGRVLINIEQSIEEEFNINLRCPSWCKDFQLMINGRPFKDYYVEKGYIKIYRIWEKSTQIILNMDMETEIVKPHPRVLNNKGKVALMRGPLVYCFESVDQIDYDKLTISGSEEFKLEFDEELVGGIVKISLYEKDEFKAMAVPYYAWDNRKAGKMKVWVDEAK
ncbi:MAG: glycoside hydrolase family 127 protein [Anaeromicrobium sp.]|jgi:DUF1680 family protein|uniref:glycoside hydrolase family 127 protein n=1 Tax=Anaeromicrobium sp. TaxID=1929132 RepID=UPI0025E36377|nr:beta-L-arabinofuranosidase domain-containing protein [Anaeromicrobium sp.]MCT4593711.1 glycoside hydrolase family 127 protein [Anaeromicrobium sp.]